MNISPIEDLGMEEGGNDSEDEESESEELVDLPLEMADLFGDRVFKTEKELQLALEEAGVGDLSVVLVNGKPRLVMPSDQHNTFTSEYVSNFLRWSKFKWGFCSATHKIHLSNGQSREPDISYWGYPRCSYRDVVLVPTVDDSVPDVVIQFSWKNKKAYEEKAIDDMMNQSLERNGGAPSTTRPTVGYLIKARFSKKRKLAGAAHPSKTQDLAGLDISKLPHGTTIVDAENLTNGAEKWTYFPGGQDRNIVITPQDLGITGIWAMVCGEYRIPVSKIYDKMNEYQKDRQNRKLAV